MSLAQADAGNGMLPAVAILWFILIGTGATLDVHHKQVQTAEDIVDGRGTPISMNFLLLIGQNRELMGEQAIGTLMRFTGWTTVLNRVGD